MDRLDEIRKIIEDAEREAGRIMLSARDIAAGVEEKSGVDNFVTAYDKKVQEYLKKRFAAEVPEAGFVGEEEASSVDVTKGMVFIVDPIDGTSNFLYGYNHSCISVGVLSEGEAVLGLVYDPYRDELFSARAGQGALLNGKPIHVSGGTVENGLVLVGTAPYYREELGDDTFRMIRAYFNRCVDIRRTGSAALDLCSVACGRAALFCELRLSPWDYAAGALIVREAGGRVMTADLKPLTYDRRISVIATGCADGEI
ncbi:MAG: inositol monophosphatase family protein [Lachnospiraceae bacterium]|jgi:myo-inositol-1(or 4)-monophosphatase